MTRTLSQPSTPRATAPSPSFRSSRQRIRIIQLLWAMAIIGYFVWAREGHGSAPNPQKYLVFLLVLGVVSNLFVRMASASARRDIRDQESDRRPKGAFRYLSRLTDGLQGERLTSFVGGMRRQPRLSPQAFNATGPFVRLSIFSNGVRVGPSSSLLSMSVPTWEARFDELDVIQAIGRVKGLTTGILFRKSQSHEWVIFWTANREAIFTTLEHTGVTGSREPVQLRAGSQWRVKEFVEDDLRPSEPSVLGAAPTAAPIATSSAPSPLVFATPLTSNISNLTTTAPEDRKWPGVVVGVVVAFVVVSTFVLVFNLVDSGNSVAPGAANNAGVVTTVTGTAPVVTASPAAWRTAVENNIRYLSPPLAGIPNSILHLRYNYGVTYNSYDLSDLTSDLQSMSLECTMFHGLVDNGAPSPALAKDTENVSVACSDLVSVDHVDLNSSNNKWTPKLASNDRHWLKILQERLEVLNNAAQH